VEDGAIGAGATDLRATGMPDPVAVRPNPVAGRPDPVVVRPDLVAGRPDPAASDCSGGAPWMDSLGNRFLYSLSRLAQCSLNLIRLSTMRLDSTIAVFGWCVLVMLVRNCLVVV